MRAKLNILAYYQIRNRDDVKLGTELAQLGAMSSLSKSLGGKKK